MNPTSSHLSYQIDAHDRIRAVGGPWDRWAAENAAPELVTEKILDRPLWRFIGGDDVQQFLRLIFERARSSGETMRLPFRCDSPRQRRFMDLTIRPLPDEGLHIATELVREEAREYMPLLERSSRLLYGILRMCSWCKRIRLFNGQWVEIEEAAQRMNLFHAPDLPTVSHGICLPCAEEHLGFTTAQELHPGS